MKKRRGISKEAVTFFWKTMMGVIGNDRHRLETLLRVNTPLCEMYTMKEQLRRFWELRNEKETLSFPIRWVLDAMSSEIK
jgi:hypothetical protein